jgi:hypothetical protein
VGTTAATSYNDTAVLNGFTYYYVVTAVNSAGGSLPSAQVPAIPPMEDFRTDPAARGGDIDVLLLTEQRLALGTLRRIRRAILDRIGEQKLDIVNFTRAEQHPFKDIALATAAKL